MCHPERRRRFCRRSRRTCGLSVEPQILREIRDNCATKMPEQNPNPESNTEETEPMTSAVPGEETAVESSAAPEPFTLEPKPIPPTPEPKRPSKEKEEASQSPFSVTVGQVYDGPLDLLLDLIRKQNIDIYDIPIARITSQFLDYTQHLKQVDVDSAGEFIYMASLLIHIKSKTLLPLDPSDVAGGDSYDPRR